jgi:hypothetical protein
MKKTITIFLGIYLATIIGIGCKKQTVAPNSNNNTPVTPNYFDTTVTVNFVIQANVYFGGGNMSLTSYDYDSNNQFQSGSNYYLTIYGNGPSTGQYANNVTLYAAGDTSHVNKCSSAIVLTKSMLFSKTKVAHFGIQIQQSSMGFQNAQFDYDPTSRKFTSIIYPVNSNAVNQASVSPSLAPNTGYSLNCQAGKWVIYCKF